MEALEEKFYRLSEDIRKLNIQFRNSRNSDQILFLIQNAKHEVFDLQEKSRAEIDLAGVHKKRRRKAEQIYEGLGQIVQRLDVLAGHVSTYQDQSQSRSQVALEIFATDSLSVFEKNLMDWGNYYKRRMTKYESGASMRPEEFDYDSKSLQAIDFISKSGNLTPPPTLATLVPVLFATDRKLDSDSPSGKAKYLDGRGDGSISYGVAEVSIPPTHRMGKLERPSIWKLQFRESTDKHIVITETRIETEESWVNIAKTHIGKTGEKSALVYIHGFSVIFDDAIRQAAQIGRDIQFPGLITLFSWGSEGKKNATGYAADGDSARLAAPRLANYLRKLNNELGIEEIHIIAHSMGNRTLIEALPLLPDKAGENPVKEVVFAAPDVDAELFRQALPKLEAKAVRYTLYGSERDRALVVSKSLHSAYPRAGDGGKQVVVIHGVETIDATLIGEDIFGTGHSYFSGQRTVLNDLFYLIRKSLSAGKRHGLAEQELGGIKYWLFQP